MVSPAMPQHALFSPEIKPAMNLVNWQFAMKPGKSRTRTNGKGQKRSVQHQQILL
jgi:hypothetical protein